MGVFIMERPHFPIIVVLTSILLPYGVVTTQSMIESTNQFWLFPLWMYVHDFGTWLGYGIIIPAILPSVVAPPLPPSSGIIWCVLGLYTSLLLYQFYKNRRDARSVWLPTLIAMIIQAGTTMILGFFVLREWSPVTVPLPLHFLIVLYYTRILIQKDAHE